MKKILFAGIVVLGSLSLSACERTDKTTDKEDEGVVVERDSVATEYEVTETVVEYDTTTRTKKVDAEKDDDDNDRKKD